MRDRLMTIVAFQTPRRPARVQSLFATTGAFALRNVAPGSLPRARGSEEGRLARTSIAVCHPVARDARGRTDPGASERHQALCPSATRASCCWLTGIRIGRTATLPTSSAAAWRPSRCGGSAGKGRPRSQTGPGRVPHVSCLRWCGRQWWSWPAPSPKGRGTCGHGGMARNSPRRPWRQVSSPRCPPVLSDAGGVRTRSNPGAPMPGSNRLTRRVWRTPARCSSDMNRPKSSPHWAKPSCVSMRRLRSKRANGEVPEQQPCRTRRCQEPIASAAWARSISAVR
jgi:hypothetical protein